MGCNSKTLALAIFSIFLISIIATPVLAADPITDFLNWLFGKSSETPTGAVGLEPCSTAADCYKAGAYYCTCDGVEKSYCTTGESWRVNNYYCANNDNTGMKCRLSSATANDASYTCVNGASFQKPATETNCADGNDNDYDATVDCGDSDCSGTTSCTTTTTTPPTTTSTSSTTTTISGATTTTYSGTTTTTVQNTCNANSPISGCYCNGSYYSTGYCCYTLPATGSGSYSWQSSACGTGSTTTTYYSTSTTYSSTCPSAILSVLGTGCHSMYTGNDGKTIYCDSSMVRSMKEGDTAAKDGCTSESNVCSTSNPWYCYSETSCKGVSANWCKSSSTSGGYCSTSTCPTCSKDSAWNCYDQSGCTGAGGNWCQSGGSSSGYCQNSACPTCSSSSPWNCYDETSCKGATGNWCKSSSSSGGTAAGSSGWCSSSSCPTCASTSKYNCYTETDCKGATGNWCGSQSGSGGYCGESVCPTYTCSKTEPWNCKDESTCKTTGASWCSSSGGYGYCSSSCPTCDKSNPWNCYTKEACAGVSAQWCSGSGGYGYCSTTCPTCSSSTKYNCYDETSCKGATGSWCIPQYGGSGWCSDSSCPTYTCSKTETWNCRDETTCKGAGASWCGTWCQSGSCPTCSKSQIWNCNTKETCAGTGANWCTSQPPVAYSGGGGSAVATPAYSSGWCQESICPTYACSKTETWYCKDQTSCTGSGGSWCTSYGGSGGYCQSGTCPTYTCSSSQPWNCFKEEDCKGTGAQWCKSTSYGTTLNGWCANSCPTCSSTQKYSCYDKTSCTGVSGYWCGTESTGWCADQKCASCSATQPWNCYDKETCTGASGKWCSNQYSTYGSTAIVSSGWCQSNDCPTCSKSQPWNCFIETDCKTNGGNWCGTWCQDSSYQCPSTKGYNVEEKKENFIKPENCKEQKDPNTGYTNYVCEKKTEEKCPELSADAKEKCESNNGKFVIKKDRRGCEFANCRFKEEFDSDKKFILKKFDRCPTAAELNEYQSSCEKSGGTLKTSLEGGCKIGFCLNADEYECEREINPKFEKEIEEKCKKEGLVVVKDFDPRGCTVLHCGEQDFCKKVPKNAYSECENQGGELVVKNDDKGCATFSECVRPGDEKVYLEEHEKITEVPDETELLSLALKLEELKVVFDKMSTQAKDLANYYKSTGSSDAKKLTRVADMFAAATGKIDEIKTTLRDKLTKITPADLEEIKLEIRTIRKVTLKDILYVMLSTKDDVRDIVDEKEKDCGTDGLCFDKSFRICQKAIMRSDQAGTFVRITGESDGKCLVEAEAKAVGIAVSMKCEVPNYALGFKNPETDVLPYCTGGLVDAIKTGKV